MEYKWCNDCKHYSTSSIAEEPCVSCSDAFGHKNWEAKGENEMNKIVELGEDLLDNDAFNSALAELQESVQPKQEFGELTATDTNPSRLDAFRARRQVQPTADLELAAKAMHSFAEKNTEVNVEECVVERGHPVRDEYAVGYEEGHRKGFKEGYKRCLEKLVDRYHAEISITEKHTAIINFVEGVIEGMER